MILLTCAIAKELAFWQVRPGVEVLATGVGPVEAAAAVAHALARQHCTLVVNAGIAGALGTAAANGDGVVVADDALELALESGDPISLPDGERVVDRAFSDPALVTQLADRGFAALHGITVTRVTASDETAARLLRRGAQVESMEGFAVLRAAQRAGVPAIEVRGISNRAGARGRSGWDFQAGIAGLERILQALFAVLDGANGAAS